MTTVLSATAHKATATRRRRSAAELKDLDLALYSIVAEVQPCTVRQVYYRAVSAYLCDKDENGYNLIKRRLLTMRRADQLPYDWIQDTMRSAYAYRRYRTLADFADAARNLYHYDYWHDSPVNVEIWVESDSIAGTLLDTVVDEFGLRLHAARGFTSESFVWKAGQQIQEDGRETFVYVLSDFDPSGVWLAHDIQRKIVRFSGDVPVHVERIALSGGQVRHWNLPTHPLKKSDRRAARFRAEHGNAACELEAIPPNDLRALVTGAILQHVNPERIAAAKLDEQMQRDALSQLPAWFKDGGRA